MLEHSVRNNTNRVALSCIDKYTLTYNDLNKKVNDIIGFLKEEGIKKGDRVALLGENHPNWGLSFFAITSAGCVAVPIMHDFSPAEIEQILEHSGTKILFISSKFSGKIEGINYKPQKIVLLDDFSILPESCPENFLKNFIEERKKEFRKIRETAIKLTGIGLTEINEDDLASLIYTSGTTGHSKGVMLTHKNIVSDVMAVVDMTEITHKDIMLSILPLSHATESTLGLITPIAAGASVYYLEKMPSATSLLPALQKIRPTIMVAVPLIIEKIYKSKILPNFRKNLLIKAMYKTPFIKQKINLAAGKKLKEAFGGRLRMLCIGGAALASDVEKFLRAAKFPYTVGYGLTETAPLVTGNQPADFIYNSVGKPISCCRVKIDNPNYLTGEGEILVKGDCVMKGYYKAPEKTKETFTEDGWFRTGDLGVLNKKGYLFIKGRIKNVILGANGKNIYPESLEAVINECRYVMESLVYDKGGKLAAKIHLDYKTMQEELFANFTNEAEIKKAIKKRLNEIIDEVNKRVPGFAKISHVYEQFEPFEKTPTLKIKRYVYV